MKNQLKAKIILDNGGGITLQLGTNFAHHYDNAEQSVRDYKEYIANGNTDGWEGNEEEAFFDPEYEEIRNGGYKVFDMEDIEKAVADEDFEGGWHNIDKFIKGMKEL